MRRPPRWGRRTTTFSLLLLGLTVALAASITVAVTLGPVPIPTTRVWEIVVHRLAPGSITPHWPSGQEQIVWEIRLPRVLLAAVVGAGLAVVGATLQALVRNPLADPYVFGLSSGAAAGATAAALFGISFLGIYAEPLAAFIGALVAFALVFGLAQRGGTLVPMRMIIAGIAVAYAMSALTSFQVFEATRRGQEDAALLVLFWLLGGFGAAQWSLLGLPAITIAVGTVVLVAQSRSLNALLVGEESAVGLGIDCGSFAGRCSPCARCSRG